MLEDLDFKWKSDRLMTLVKCVEAKAVHGERVQRWRPKSICEPPGPECLHQGVRAAGPVCCGAERTRLA